MIGNLIGWWIFAGACTWVLMDSQGVVETFARERRSRGLSVTWKGQLLATCVTILVWPWFAWPMTVKAVQKFKAWGLRA